MLILLFLQLCLQLKRVGVIHLMLLLYCFRCYYLAVLDAADALNASYASDASDADATGDFQCPSCLAALLTFSLH